MNILYKQFYTFKPLIPRTIQIYIRRLIVSRQRRLHLNTWPIDPKSEHKPKNWKGWPDGKKFSLVLSHDVESQSGHDRCLKLAKIELEAGFHSSFNFVPERYNVRKEVIEELKQMGFEVCTHGLKHDGKLFLSKRIFDQRSLKINHYLRQWNACGFTAPSMHRNLEWMHALNIEHSTSTFDTDPFEPQPEGLKTVFPFFVANSSASNGYVELPYTLPQDFTLFVLFKEKNINIWLKKLSWISNVGGMALINTHPDYMAFEGEKQARDQYPVELYLQFLEHIKSNYENMYYHALPSEIARFWKSEIVQSAVDDE